jgi:hypothetical protein
VPTAAERAGDFSDYRTASGALIPLYDPLTTQPNPNGTGFIRTPFPNNQVPAGRINPTARQLIDMLPLPNLADRTGNYAVTKDATVLRHQFDVRVDQGFSTNSKLYVRYSLTDREDETPGPYDPPLIGSTFFQQAIKVQKAHNLRSARPRCSAPAASTNCASAATGSATTCIRSSPTSSQPTSGLAASPTSQG